MDRMVIKSLQDIFEAIEEIDSYFDRYPRRFDVYLSESILKSAIHMKLSIIGEATNRILKVAPEIRITNARQIVNTRNYLIHGYDSLRPEMIWAIIINDLPLLRREVTELIESSGCAY